MDIYSGVVNSTGCREIICPTTGCRVTWSTTSLSFFSHLVALRIVSDTFLPRPLPASPFSRSLNLLSQRNHIHGWHPQLCPMVDLLWRRLEQDWDRTTSGLISQKPPLQPLYCPKSCCLHPIQVMFHNRIYFFRLSVVIRNWKCKVLNYFRMNGIAKRKRSLDALTVSCP